MGEALRAVAPVDHRALRELDRRRIGRVEEEHRRRGRRRNGCLPSLRSRLRIAIDTSPKSMSTGQGDDALVADRAVVGDVGELVEVAQGDAAPRLLLVQERLDQQRRGEDLVARGVEQVRARHVRRAHRLALAAAQAVLDRVGDLADLGLLEDQALVADQRKARRVGVGEVRAGQQLAGVEAPFGSILPCSGRRARARRRSGIRAW